MDLSKLTIEELIQLYKDYVKASDGAAYFVKLAKEKGWW
jgi:hypothetical protein